jgi:hypothetical protein
LAVVLGRLILVGPRLHPRQDKARRTDVSGMCFERPSCRTSPVGRQTHCPQNALSSRRTALPRSSNMHSPQTGR